MPGGIIVIKIFILQRMSYKYFTMNDSPYRFLQINANPLVDNYAQGKNLKSLFTYSDYDCKLLKSEIRNFFLERNLYPEIANLWTHMPNSVPDFYHTDRVKQIDQPNIEVAVNWLLDGEPGITQWSHAAINHKIKSGGIPKSGVPTDWYVKHCAAEFSAVLDRPMLIRVDVPHIVDTTGTNTYRLSYSLRFKGDPSWEYCLEQLKDVIL